MSLIEAALALGLSYGRVRGLVLRGVLAGRQVGGRYGEWRVTRASVEAYRRECDG